MAITTVRPSSIHGYGLFAARPICAGETILDWSGCARRLSDEQVAALPPEESRYISRIDGQYVLFLVPARFVNHSCDPNARAGSGRDVAVRDIAEGEEITVDYVAEQVPDLDLLCGCGSPRCRVRLTTS
jgi:SET domain-containing protein